MSSKSKKILTNIFGTGFYNLLLVVNLAVVTTNLKAESFTYFSFVVAASGLSAVIFGAGIPAWMQINLAEPKKTPALRASIARAFFATMLLQCLSCVVALLGHLYFAPADYGNGFLFIYLLQMAMTISFLSDGVAIGVAAVWFLNVRRLIPEVLFSSYLAWSAFMGGDLEQVTEVYVLCWIVAALSATPFVVKQIGIMPCMDRNLWLLIWKASAYLQWALAQAVTQRGSVLLAASYGTYETVVLFRWAQIIASTASHAYNAIAQVVFPLHKSKNARSRISLMAALNLAEFRISTAIALIAMGSLILTGLYYLAIDITSEFNVSANQAIIFMLFLMATIAYLFCSTQANWRGLRIQYLLSQYISLASALLVLALSLIFFGTGLNLPDVSYLLGALAAGKMAGFFFLILGSPSQGSAPENDKR